MKKQFSIYDKIRRYSIFMGIKDNHIIYCDFSSPDNLLPSQKEIEILIGYLGQLYKSSKGEIKKHNKETLKNLKELKKKANSEKRVLEIKENLGYIYVIKADKYYKIGKAEKPEQRVEAFITSCPFEIDIILFKLVKNYARVETLLHKKFKEKKYRSEWFLLNQTDISKIKIFLDKQIKNK